MELVAVASLGALIVASQTETGIPYFGPGVAVVGTLGALYMLWRFQRSIVQPLERRADSTDTRLRRETRQRETCEWRLGELVMWLRQSEGMAVPDHILLGHPPWEEREDG